MDALLTTYEAPLRLASFAGLMVVMMIAEALWPRRARSQTRSLRWVSNLGLTFLNSALLRLLFPLVAVGVAALCAERGWGLFNSMILPDWVEIVAAFILLDFAIWAQHVAMHKVPLLWRLHRMHHSDVDLDATSGARFHPLEIMLSMAYKMALVLLLGPSVAAVILFEILLTGGAVFNHSNVRLPLPFDRLLRLVLVTPDMHRVHHSSIQAETDSNYGFFIPWWDRLFKTYVDQPAGGHQGMQVGLETYRSDREGQIGALLIQPLSSPQTEGQSRSGQE